MFAIYKRELRSFFHGMMGYVLTAFLLAASGIYFLALNLGYGLTDFGYYTLYRTIFMLLLYFPVLAMRSLAEERRARTDQLLLTLSLIHISSSTPWRARTSRSAPSTC